MDAERLASILHSLAASGSRRTILSALFGGPLVLQRVARAQASSKKKRKNNPCKGQPDDTPCKGTGRCLSGECAPKPGCLAADADCSTNQAGCCSRMCFHVVGPKFECVEGGAEAGDACQADNDCVPGLTCLGYVCQSLTCNPVSDFCADGTTACGAGNAGLCLRPLGGDRTRCGKPSPTTSCGCTSNRQCINAQGAGAFCARFKRGGVCICNDKTSFCAVPA